MFQTKGVASMYYLFFSYIAKHIIENYNTFKYIHKYNILTLPYGIHFKCKIKQLNKEARLKINFKHKRRKTDKKTHTPFLGRHMQRHHDVATCRRK